MLLPSVIVVDDCETDRYLARRVIGRAAVAERIVELEDGDLLIPLLDDPQRRRAECGTPPPPILVLLDINMPRRGGFELLEDLAQRFAAGKTDPSCFVVMMFTSSDNEGDRRRSMQYEFVKDYLVKPIDVDGIRDLVARHYADVRAA